MSLDTTDGGRRHVDSIPPQPTVMVTGSDRQDLRAVAAGLFERRAAAEDGAVVITTDESPTAVVDRLGGSPVGFAPERIAFVDARDDEGASTDGWLQDVSIDAAPGVVDDAVSDGLSWLAGTDVQRRHFLYDTLAADGYRPDPDAAYDRAYQVAMTVGAEDGLALLALDTEGLDRDVVERLAHLVDVHVEVRRTDGDAELRWEGLLGASDGWVSMDDAEFGVGGFR